ncbi:hypothetical protein CRUP_000358 [Coryphaenoides rupestris]|nr:hypothetical protein CRUP_000358 [Coryphaenoides rupestris]
MNNEGKLFIAGLCFDTDETGLNNAFTKHGTVLKADMGLVTVGGPAAVTGGGPPFPGERPLGRPVAPKEESRGAHLMAILGLGHSP